MPERRCDRADVRLRPAVDTRPAEHLLATRAEEAGDQSAGDRGGLQAGLARRAADEPGAGDVAHHAAVSGD